MTTIDLLTDTLKSARQDHQYYYEAINLLQKVALQIDGNGTVTTKTIKAIEKLLDDIYKHTI